MAGLPPSSRKVLSLPSRFLKQQSNHDMSKERLGWKKGLPPSWIYRFVCNGLIPFLKDHGYSVGFTEQTLERYCIEWAFIVQYVTRHASNLYDYRFMKCVHNGGSEEFDWFLFKIPSEDWDALADDWQQPEFLDDTDTGVSQRKDLPFFAWRVVQLYGSPAHEEWIYTIDHSTTEEDDNFHILSHYDDHSAFGGDRRTL
jgi:hypothetical protein